MAKKFKIQKIPLEILLTALGKLWADGAEYVDIDVTLTRTKDGIEVSAKDSYYINDAFSLGFFSKDEYEELIYLGP